ncbi:hypothetical protein THRCLA_05096 [Thraustotheca clavata]|uniref:J domain-containing protein n=1 Tax=Thraustotheca clavata TaxID=74557 RepID=A0A1V9ZX14_9STRA|nr:hypothetical protein THRCLA_05096 [Thraustotheca clavata]
MGDSPRGRVLRSGSGSVLGGEASNAEDYIARFQTTKLSWKGKYERIFALSSTRFSTIDPKDFDLTNSWSFGAFLSIDLDPSDDYVFTITFNGPKKEEQLKLRYKYRSYLVSEFLRIHAFFCAGSPVRPATPAPANIQVKCTKLTRHDAEVECVLEIAVDAILYRQSLVNGPVSLGRYTYTDIDHITPLANSANGLVLGFGGKNKIFFTPDRQGLLSRIEKACSRVGVRITSRGSMTLDGVKDARYHALDDAGELMGEFSVQKYSSRYETPIRRILRIYTKYLVECDVKSEHLVSRTAFGQVFCLVRTASSKSRFEIEKVNGQRRMYACKERDALIASIYDAYAVNRVAESNDVLVVSPTNSHNGLRLLPRFATEDPTETRTFFGDTSIGSTFLKRLAAVGKYTGGSGHRAGLSAGRGLVSIAGELNANVPMTGIQYFTKRSIISDALKPLAFQLRTVATCSPPAPKMAVALLQCFCIIATSYYGFLDMVSLPQFIETLINFLNAEDALTVFWTTLLIQRLTIHRGNNSTVNVAAGEDVDFSTQNTNNEAESINKRVLFGNEKLVQALMSQLGTKPNGVQPSPLTNLGVLQTLEAALCSRRSTTDPTDVKALVGLLVPYYDSLIRLLFRSHCAATIEACTLLVQTVLQLCPPQVASRIKDAALGEGLVLQHLYQSMFDTSFDQRCVSRYLITMWMSNHVPAKKLLKRILPLGLVSCLDMRTLSPPEVYQLDELEKDSFEEHKLSFFNAELSPTSRSHEGSFNDEDEDSFVASMRGVTLDNLLYENISESTQQPQTRSDSSTLQNQPQYADNVVQTQRGAINVPDVALPRLIGKIHTEPRGAAKNVFQDPTITRKRSTREGSGFASHLSLLKKAFTTRQSISSPSASNADTPIAENFRILFHMLLQDHDSIDLYWNSTTREELRRALIEEIQVFRDYQATSNNVVWNYDEFYVEYPTLKDALIVDGLHLKRILESAPDADCNDEDTWQPPQHPEELPIKQPKRFIIALYKRFLREYPYAEFRDEPNTTLSILQVMALVTWLYETEYQLNADDVVHIMKLLRETRRKDLLINMLRALRCITKSPINAGKLLHDNEVISWLVQIIQMAHVAQRRATDVPMLWSIEHIESQTKIGPTHVENLITLAEEQGWNLVKECQVYLFDEDPNNICHAVPVDDIAQLRWELAVNSSIASNVVAMAHDAVHILCDLLHSNVLLTTSRYIYPLPHAMAQTQSKIQGIVPALVLHELPALAENIAHILVTLFASGKEKCQDLYLSGVYYMIFCYNGSNFVEFSRFLQLTHAQQTRSNGERRNILADVLPTAMISHLDMLSRQQFNDLFCSDSVATAKVIWNKYMRDTLWNACVAHVEDYKRILEQNVAAPYKYFPIAPISFANLDTEYYCYGLYLQQFCSTSAGTYIVDNPAEFLKALRYAWEDEVNRTNASMTPNEAADVLGLESTEASKEEIRKAFKFKAVDLCPEYALNDLGQYEEVMEAFEILTAPRQSLVSEGYDATNLALILNTQIRLCIEYVNELHNSYEYEAYPLLLQFLEDHCTANEKVPTLTTPSEHKSLTISAAELLFRSCNASPQNIPVLLSQSKLYVVEAVLTHCVDHLCLENDSTYLQTAGFIVQTIARLVGTEEGRSWAEVSESILNDFWRCMWIFQRKDIDKDRHLYRILRHILEALTQMLESTQLQDKIVSESGILWHLLCLLFEYNVDLDMSTSQIVLQQTVFFDPLAPMDSITNFVGEALNVLADMALTIVFRLCGYFCITPPHKNAIAMFSALLTPNLITFLGRNKNRHVFFTTFQSETQSPSLIWTNDFRTELKEYLGPCVGNITEVPNMEAALSHRFEALKTHCLVNKVYLTPLFDTLINAGNVPSVDLIRELALPDTFYEALFDFIENGQRDMPDYCGWALTNESILQYRQLALGILESLAKAVPAKIEMGCLRSRHGLATLMSNVLPPDHKEWIQLENESPASPRVPVTLEMFEGFHSSALNIVNSLAISPTFSEALFQAGYVSIVMHAILLEDESSATVMSILGRLCASSPTIARNLVSSIWIYHVLLWLFPDTTSVSDSGQDCTKAMQVPAAMIISALADEKSVVCEDTMNIFIRFIPVTLIYDIITSPQRVQEIIQAKCESPDLVWNDAMRAHLRQAFHHISILVNQCTDNGEISEELLAAEIDYAEVYPYPVVGDVYLLLYLENPIFPLRDPKFFLECLVEDFEKICQALLQTIGDTNRTSFNPDLIMMRRQQAQILPLISSCIVCVSRVFPVLLDQIIAWKTHEKLCSLFVQFQSHHKESTEEDIQVCEISLLRLFRIFFTSQKIVASLAYSPFNILSRLFSHCYLRRVGDYHIETGFILESVRRFLFHFPDNGDKNSDRNVVAVVSSFNLIDSLLELIEHPQTLQRVSNPILTRAIIVAILNLLETHRTQGNIAHNVLKKNKKWDKIYRHEPTDAIRTQPEDKFLVGPAANADAMIRNYLATKSASMPMHRPTPAPAPKKKLNVKSLFGH